MPHRSCSTSFRRWYRRCPHLPISALVQPRHAVLGVGMAASIRCEIARSMLAAVPAAQPAGPQVNAEAIAPPPTALDAEMQKSPVQPLLDARAPCGKRQVDGRLALGRRLALEQGSQQVGRGRDGKIFGTMFAF